MHPSLNIDRGTLADFCRTHHILRLSLFGSQLTGTAGPHSDIDLDVRRKTATTAVPALAAQLETLLGAR
ncbi:MAG: nucleotidyltransferase domain-containing protein [Burkholderiales bacterium]|nr:nucleotidyltransferase domain-containing protein [Burkholderiales bacterium]